MKFILIFTVLALVARNALYMGAYSEAIRGLGLALFGLAGISGVLNSDLASNLKKYWSIHLYVFFMLLSTLFSDNLAYIFFQNASLIVVFAFSMALYEVKQDRLVNVNVDLFKAIVYSYTLICIASLAMVHFSYSTAYEVLWAGELRFRGVFAKSGMMGATAGVLIGVAVFSQKNIVIKSIAVSVGLACLALTLSRTFWVAATFSYILTNWRYKPKSKKMIYGSVVLGIIVILISSLFNLSVDLKGTEKVTRTGSISSLSGRVDLWKEGLSAASNKPILGYGLTAGSTALESSRVSLNGADGSLDETRSRGRRTFHSGYIQALLDGGIIGLLCYVLVLLTSLVSIFKYDDGKKYPAEFYCILFLLVSNFSENIIYAVTVFNSSLFWMIAVFSMQLRFLTKKERAVYVNKY